MTVGRGRQWLEMVFSYQRVAGSGKSYELRRVARAARGGGDSRDRRSRFVANRGFRPAPAGLSEQMPVFECRAAPEPADGGRLAPPLVGARGVSAGRPARHREILAELWAEPVAMLRIAGLCGAAGHSNRGFAEPQRGGRKAEFSLRAEQQVEKLRPNGSGERSGHWYLPLTYQLASLDREKPNKTPRGRTARQSSAGGPRHRTQDTPNIVAVQ